ncbi:MAG: DNA gyrase subunit A, partial [Dongiaceae bacterium]
MSVIVSRALPDVRDGLKPVHRRILFAMKEGGYDAGKPFRKSARIVGDVMGKYHPHGDTAIYDAMVRMAQDFSMRLPLIEGQGNFGSMDGDAPAAMRYTEARLDWSAEALIADIDKDTVDFQPNYDGSEKEPQVLPAQYPNLLVNGANGIAVGMATNIAPHNLGEVIDACLRCLDNPEVSIEELIEIVPGPDFPTGASIIGRGGAISAFKTGRGSIIMRAKHHIEELKGGREAIVFTEIPYQVNKSKLLERIGEIAREKIIEGISDMRDESDRDGVRVVVETKKDVDANVLLNQLYKHTPLQTSFGINNLALNEGRPEQMNLKQMLQAFLTFREEVITRRSEFDLGKARDRAHILLGLAIAVANIDAVIELIRKAADPNVAREQLMAKAWPFADVAALLERIGDPKSQIEGKNYKLTEAQAKAILDLRLQRLTGLERDKIANELDELSANITGLLEILRNRARRLDVMREELRLIKQKFATPRRSVIEDSEVDQDIEDLIQREDMVVTVSHAGYIKRVPLSTYRAQRRGGKGRSGMSTKEEDFVTTIFPANTHTPILFFSTKGKVYELKTYRLPLGNPQARGKPMINMLPLEAGETISTVLVLPEDEASWPSLNIMFATSEGNVRRNTLNDFLNIKANGKIAMKLEGDERLISVKTCTEDQDILLSTAHGKAIRFNVNEVRVFSSRNSTGVRGIKLAKNDLVIGMTVLKSMDALADEREAYVRMSKAERRSDDEVIEVEEKTTDLTLTPERYQQLAVQEEFILTVTAKGFAKRTSAYEYRTTGRGGSGIAAVELTGKNGWVVNSFPVENKDQIMLVTNGGKLIRCPVKDIRIAGRRTQGVTVLKVEEGE